MRSINLHPQAEPQQQPALAQWARLQAGVLSHTQLQPAAIQLVSDLAQALGCERVSLGLLRKSRARVVALSQGGDDRFRGSAATELEAAMDEALDQDGSVLVPEPAGAMQRIHFAHDALLARGIGAAATLPLRANGVALGAVTLEWRNAKSLAALDTAQLEHQLMLVAPLLALLQRCEQPLAARFKSGVVDTWQRNTWRRRAIATSVAASVLGLLAWPGTLHIGGKARIEGALERAITAPADGFLKTVQVRPGDGVAEGQLLLEMAEQDLRVDAQRLAGEVAQHDSATHAAFAQSDRSQMAIHLARAEEAKAQLTLVSGRIGRARVEAPFAGVVLDGDLTRAVGAPVKRGDVLLTLAPFEGRRVVIQIDERSIASVRPGQEAILALASTPWQTLSLKVSRVRPIARSVEGRSVFEVEAVAADADTDAALAPGMTGAARVTIGREPAALTWSRRAIDAARLCWWRWGF